jgi:hypothetical protein
MSDTERFGEEMKENKRHVNKGTGSRDCTFRNYRVRSIHRKKGRSQSSEDDDLQTKRKMTLHQRRYSSEPSDLETPR